MKKAFYKGVAVALLHLLIVLSLGAKLLYDRAHRPRVWVKTGQIDPDMPVRGRYFTLSLEVEAPWVPNGEKEKYGRSDVQLSVQNGKLVANETDSNTGLSISTWRQWSRSGSDRIFLDQGVPFFIPEHAAIPRTRNGDELWVEVTIPRKGPPRPIQLALKTNAGEWKPLGLR